MDFAERTVQPAASHLVLEVLARRHTALGVETDGETVLVVFADPADHAALAEITATVQAESGLVVTPAGAERAELLEAIELTDGAEATHELDTNYTVPGVARYRVNVYLKRDAVAMSMRAIPYEVVTIEEPIEFVHESQMALVSQRDVGTDTVSFATALRQALRQDPDVILVGEMRDLETISTAVTAAETGHLVFATLHTQDAAQTIDRIVDAFPSEQQDQVRIQVASTIQGIVSQQLVPMIQSGKKFGMNTMDEHLGALVRDGTVAFEAASLLCRDANELRRYAGVFPVPAA